MRGSIVRLHFRVGKFKEKGPEQPLLVLEGNSTIKGRIRECSWVLGLMNSRDL